VALRAVAVASLLTMVAACAPMPQPIAPPPANPPAGMQYLYGSGEAAALSVQAFAMLASHATATAKARPAQSVVLTSGASLDQPRFVPCGDKPFAAVFDVDETVLLNIGYEYHDARSGKGYDEAAWDAWERTGAGAVSPVPGAVAALAQLRAAGVTVVFNTNRSAANAAATAQAISAAGLGQAVHGQTLFLQGDDAMGSGKDGRRATIASRYCVIALGGDQLGDFSDLFNAGQPVAARRVATTTPAIAALWGRGWFVLPNPVYGSGLKGGFDDVFPMDRRWALPTDGEKN
jgi:5'-nucleotidase (lipoprotein e(P4) family)